MKIILKILIVTFLSIMSLFSCKEDDDMCSNVYVEYKNIEDISNCQETLWNFTLNTEENFIIVRNQEEFEQFVNAGNCMVDIDFSDYDLILGSHYISPEATFEYEVIDNCSENRLYILVRLINDQSSGADEKAVFHVLVPKLMNNEIVQVNFAT